MRVGLDFDNTIAGYDGVFAALGAAAGMPSARAGGSKRELREALRRLPDGERRWQQIQATAYGPRMAEAQLMPGVRHFLELCRKQGASVVIVSHKTRTAAADPDGCDLRQAAMRWMQAQGLFEGLRTGLSPEAVHFEDSRGAKVARVAQLACDAFVDDLEEVLLHPDFPPRTRALLYAPHGAAAASPRYRSFASWSEIADELFRLH